MSAVLILISAIAGGVLFMASFRALIRWGLRAPRVIEKSSPEAVGLKYSDAKILTANGKTLFAWFIPALEPGAAAALAVLHGWGSNAETMLPLAVPLHRAGYALLFFDARSHGRSDADSFSSLPRFAEDLDSVLSCLKLQPGVDPERVGVVGHSVGAAAALLSASRRDDLAAVVSIAAFAHPETVMRRLLAARHVPYVPFGWYVLRYVEQVIGNDFDDIAPLNTIGRIRCPVLLVHGSEDETVPVAEAQALHARRRGGALLVVKGSHDSYEDLEPRIGELVDFLLAAMRPK